jgi:hypothetical protein
MALLKKVWLTTWLQDDYVKFIRFGQWRIEQSGDGVLAYINNNGYLDNPTYRERYAEFLKIDFPRVPLTPHAELFWQLVSLGSECIALPSLDLQALPLRNSAQAQRRGPVGSFPVPGDNRVKRRGGFSKFIPAGESRTKTSDVAARIRMYINADPAGPLEQYFAGVPEAMWDFEMDERAADAFKFADSI